MTGRAGRFRWCICVANPPGWLGLSRAQIGESAGEHGKVPEGSGVGQWVRVPGGSCRPSAAASRD